MPVAAYDDARGRGTLVVAVKRRGEPNDGPHGKPYANDPDQPPMLSQPRTDATGRPGRAPAGINPAPRRQPAGAPSEHIVHMHHELVVRELVLASLVKDSLKGLLAIRRVAVARRTPRLRRRDPCDRGRRHLARRSSVTEDGSRRRIKELRRTPRKTLLVPARSRRRTQTLSLRHVSPPRRGRH
jgi:hypothetical protein